MDQSLVVIVFNSDVGLVVNANEKYTGKQNNFAQFIMLQIEEGKHIH